MIFSEKLPDGQPPLPGQVLILHMQVIEESFCECSECHESGVPNRPVVRAEGLSREDHGRGDEGLDVVAQHRVLEDEPKDVQGVDL